MYASEMENLKRRDHLGDMCRWEDNIKMDPLVGSVNTVKNIRVQIKSGNFSTI
jgi:hypothetical protein